MIDKDMYAFEIKLEGVEDYVTQTFLDETEIQTTTGKSENRKCATLHWPSIGAHIVGGPEFCLAVECCGQDVDKARQLCLKTIISTLTPDALLRAVTFIEEHGKAIGREQIRNELKTVLDIKTFEY